MEIFLGILILIGCYGIIYFVERIINPKPKNDITPQEDKAIKNIIDIFIQEQKRPLTEKEIITVVSAVKYWRQHNGHSPLMKNKLSQFLLQGESHTSNDDLILDTIIWKQWKIECPEDYKKEQNEINRLKSK